MPDLEYTVTETATVLGVSRSRVLQFLASKRLRGARRKGPIWLIPVEAVRAFARLSRPVGNPNFRKKRGQK